MIDADWLTTAEAAAELGLTPFAIRKAIERGTLRPRRLHPRLSVIERCELERYRRETRRGRPPRDANL